MCITLNKDSCPLILYAMTLMKGILFSCWSKNSWKQLYSIRTLIYIDFSKEREFKPSLLLSMSLYLLQMKLIFIGMKLYLSDMILGTQILLWKEKLEMLSAHRCCEEIIRSIVFHPGGEYQKYCLPTQQVNIRNVVFPPRR